MVSVPFCIWLAWLCQNVASQLAWTPIYATEKNQIDLWTQEARGCSCPWYGANNSCACCVSEGGCHCGKEAPNRCTQCGLEQHCTHMCNVTVVSSELQAKSGKTFGQIKLPSIEGPTFCWYTFVPTSHQRVEVQIYRIGNIGRHVPGAGCTGGFVQLISGTEPIHSPHEYQLCSEQERYSPPVVFFIDDGIATLLLQIDEKTVPSQFLAYFSFSAVNNTDGLGMQARGGMRLQNTDCDWLYQDFECEQPGHCVLASPGYPGIYPPYRQCKYHITTKSESTQVRITFTAMLLPQSRCKTDNIAIYKGTIPNNKNLLESFCGNQRKSVDLYGQNLLIVFSSGAQVPPFDYNGFVAHLDFYEKKTTTASPIITTSKAAPVEKPTPSPTPEVFIPAGNFTGYEVTFSGNNTRSGHFDTREHDWYHNCRLIFKGRSTDIVHISLYNYRLRSPQCKTIVEIYDGPLETRKSLLEKICSPQDKPGKDKIHETKKIFSSGNELIIYFQRPTIPQATSEVEYIAGRYFFHDEQISGTIQPQGMCDVIYKGSTSPLAGIIDNPSSQHLYWDVEGVITCKQTFIPSSNQSITIKILNLDGMSTNPKCVTQCGDNGCICATSVSLQKIDHLLLVNEDGANLACLCGGYQQEWLPVSVRSWGSLSLIYSVAQYTWTNKGFGLSGSYAFTTDSVCGQQIYTVHSGEITLKNVTSVDNLNNFYEQNCMWTLHSNVERQLELEITSKQNRPCTAWNISIHEYFPSAKHHLGDTLYTFCSRDNVKAYLLPWKLNTVIVRLRTMSRTLPQFKIKWFSQVVRANTRYGNPTPVPNAISCASSSAPFILVLMICVFQLCTKISAPTR